MCGSGHSSEHYNNTGSVWDRIGSLSNRNPLQNILILKNRDIEKKCFVATKHKKYLGYYRIIMIIVVVVVVDAVIPIFIGFINYYRCFCPLLTVWILRFPKSSSSKPPTWPFNYLKLWLSHFLLFIWPHPVPFRNQSSFSFCYLSS